MKFNELWLREWIKLNIDSKTLIKQMTMSGLEVDNIEPVAGYFTGVVIGRIIEYQQHPKNNKFYIIKLDFGQQHLLNVISDYTKCFIGLCVAVAPTGAILHKNFKVTTIKIYGEISEGVLCTFSDLGIFKNNNNSIIQLPFDAPIGADIKEYLQLKDNIIHVNITPNRADCFSLLGIARDISAYNHIQLKYPITNSIIPIINDQISININISSYYLRYLCRIIKDIDINVITPLWITEKLRRCGIYPENVVIDIINYVVLELGQPIYAFDKRKITGNITIRKAFRDETILLPNNKLIILDTDTVVTTDDTKIIAISGIASSLHSSIDSLTNSIILESAYFDPAVITGRAYRYNINSNTAYLYERGVDPAIQEQAIERTTSLLVTICGGLIGPIINAYTTTTPIKQIKIELHRKNLYRIIGSSIKDTDVNIILTNLGFKVKSIDTGWCVYPPSWRFDIILEEDVIEEVIRIYGYDNIPSIPINVNLDASFYKNKNKSSLIRIKTLLIDRGYQEVITYSFVNPDMQLLLNPNQQALVLQNPISKDMSVMRTTLWTGLLNTIIYNQNRQQKRIRVFENGLCFFTDELNKNKIHQDLILSGMITGMRFNEHWDSSNSQVDFYDIKGDLEAIFEIYGKLHDIEFKSKYHPALHPGQSAGIYLQNILIGFAGLLHPKIMHTLNLNNHILAFELFWEKIYLHNTTLVKNISKFPVNRRDIAIIIAENILVADVIKECKQVIKDHLVEINLFDIYRGKSIPKGFKSITMSLIIQDTTHTLTEQEIITIITKCLVALNKRFHATLRS